MTMQRPQIIAIGAAVLALLLVVSGIRPFDHTTWVLEVFPILIAMPVLWATYRRFPADQSPLRADLLPRRRSYGWWRLLIRKSASWLSDTRPVAFEPKSI